MGELVRFVSKSERELALFEKPGRSTTASFRRVIPSASIGTRHPQAMGASAQAFIAARGPIMIAIMWSIHWHTILGRFAEIWVASLAPTFLVGYQFASRRRTASQVLGARRSPFAAVRPRPVLPSRGPAAPPQG